MRGRFFNPDGWLWKPLGYLGDFVMLSLLWAVCCIPILTIGASTTALYDTAAHVLRRSEGALFPRFFGTFRRELLPGALSTLLWAAVLLAAYWFYTWLAAALPESGSRTVVLAAVLFLLAYLTLAPLGWVFPLLSRFTFRTLALNATALRLAFGHILRSAGLALLIAAVAVLGRLFILPVMVLPGAAALAATFLIEPVFQRYEQAEEEAP